MKRLFKFIGWFVGILVMLLIVLAIYVRLVAAVDDPEISENLPPMTLETHGAVKTYGKNWIRQSESGLFEMYVEGAPYERGVAIGKLSQDLIQYQEEVFNKQINQLVPSKAYLGILKYFVGWFNRDLDDNVAEEFRQEIYGVSRAASAEFDYIAPPYHRILNYHAAHDIGHALQNMSLVGCTAFATWAGASEDSSMIVGRNFDFYVGDEFAKNKIIAFYHPDKGHNFMMVTFGGMTGVLSGMNDKGLTVTLNAAKSEIPMASATPVSILAREILQYASTIDEAMLIAKGRKTFVAESFLIASAKDKRAVIIEKSPDAIDLYSPGKDYIIGTNHYQSPTLGTTPLNREHMRTSASVYRYERVDELLNEGGRNSVAKTASILRNQKGLKNTDIGFGNEKAVNQLIAHHAVIFQPELQRVWVSTAPWQLGKFVCYDLKKVFSTGIPNGEIADRELEIPADTFLTTRNCDQMMKFNRFRFPFQPRENMIPDSLVAWNPHSYLSYMLAGDFYFARKDFSQAKKNYEKGLQMEVATLQEREHMQRNLETCNKQINQ